MTMYIPPVLCAILAWMFVYMANNISAWRTHANTPDSAAATGASPAFNSSISSSAWRIKLNLMENKQQYNRT